MKIKTVKQIIDESNNIKDDYIKTGFKSFDDTTGGLAKSSISVFASRPAMGKSSLAFKIASNVLKDNKNVLYISLENTEENIAKKILSQNKNTPNNIPYNLNLICPMHDTNFNNIYELVSLIPSLDLIIIDYYQLIDETNFNEELVISKLKELANKLNTHIMILSTLPRNIETRINKRPVLTDLIKHHKLVEESNLICFLYKNNNIVELNIRKNKQTNKRCKINLLFDHDTHDIKELDNVH